MSEQALDSDLLNKLIHFLSQPETYPHNPDRVKHIQTHISHVFIASPYVYKLKKPVDLGFLDYSTLEKRKRYCQREIALNRRLSEDIYLDVVSIVQQGQSFSLAEGEGVAGEIVEYAVKMRQLEERYFLHAYLENESLTREHLDRVAGKLANFYNRQSPGEEILRWGKIGNIKVNTDENFKQTVSFIGKTIDKEAYQAIQYYTNTYLEQNKSLFERRIDEKRIVDGHGDLHLEHIHITPEQVQIYDCIEFNERFRYGDLAVDLAYLAMDLDFNNCWQKERYFIDQMAQKLDDPGLLQIIDFYKCYRAYVKGKVKSIQSSEEEVPAEEREKAAELAARYFNLSLRYATLGSQPIALIVMGSVGSGKSTLADHLKEKLEVDRFSSDRIRKQVAGLPLHERTSAGDRKQLYSSEMSQKTYDKLLDEAQSHLGKGKSIILDATYSNASARKTLIKMLENGDYPFLFIETDAPQDVIKQRLQARENQHEVISDARLEDFEALSKRYDPPSEIASDVLIQVSTDRSLEETHRILYRELMARNLKG